MHPLLPPELVREIASYLRKRDIFHVVFVNKLWNTTWTPFLWASFIVVARTYEITDKKYHQTLARHGGHIRNVYLRDEANLKVLQVLCKTVVLPASSLNLSSLCVSSRLHLETDVNRLVEIIRRSPQLRELELINTPVPSAWFERLLDIIAPSLARLKKLRLMHEHVHPKVTPLVMKTFLETCSSELETLVVKFGLSCPFGLYIAPPPIDIPGAKLHPKLKVLEFQIGYPSHSGPMEPVFSWVLNSFLEGCTGLEIVDERIQAFEGNRLWTTDDASIASILRRNLGINYQRCIQIPSGQPEQLFSDSEDPITKELSSALDADSDGTKRVWQAINMGHIISGGITEFDRKAIVHAATQRGFQRLVTNDEGWLSSEDLLSIFRQCPTLRVHDCGYERYPTLSAADVILQPWSCKWLKSLHLIIAGIPRPDIKTDCMDKPIPIGDPMHSGTMEESRVLQRKVCAQLGSLVCLEELRLGYSKIRDMVTVEGDEDSQVVRKYNPFLQLNCLELTLESGLDELSELKSLESFSVWGMDHRIGSRELYWMQRNWYSVRDVYGLLPLPYQESMRHFGSDPSVKFCDVAFRIM
ncbi:hypothetical protein BGZ95_003408 [Linnemannia exigua]|uniref:F-box domain-containing protein n=1 Tax=Linnemannia exigua TaxID=604196 RepID=A0AAD4DI38_9FUNG|nr:hypothetical protein BGZ95_003408 [Linnemannia exigua]